MKIDLAELEKNIHVDPPVDMDRLITLFVAIKENKPLEWRSKENPDNWTPAPTPDSNMLHVIINNPQLFRVGREVREMWLVHDSCGKWEDVGRPNLDPKHNFPNAIHVREVK